jgi:hypothetical protein
LAEGGQAERNRRLSEGGGVQAGHHERGGPIGVGDGLALGAPRGPAQLGPRLRFGLALVVVHQLQLISQRGAAG